MIKNILCGTDGSAYGDTACSYAFDFAVRLDARLEIVYVVDARLLDMASLPTSPLGWGTCGVASFREALQARGEGVLEKAAARAERAGLPVRTTLEFGNPAQTFADIQGRMEMVVLGRKGEHASSSPGMTGSTMERYIRRADRPCLVTPEKFRATTRVLVAVDGTSSSGRALHEAIELANPMKMPLFILSVAEGRGDGERARQVAEEAHALARAHDCAAASFVAEGSPGGQILAQAEAQEVDLLVLGAHGRGRVYEWILGGTAAHLASRAPMPVLLVP